jgi:hypothetical protein
MDLMTDIRDSRCIDCGRYCRKRSYVIFGDATPFYAQTECLHIVHMDKEERREVESPDRYL